VRPLRREATPDNRSVSVTLKRNTHRCAEAAPAGWRRAHHSRCEKKYSSFFVPKQPEILDTGLNHSARALASPMIVQSNPVLSGKSRMFPTRPAAPSAAGSFPHTTSGGCHG
jgi:hypothetical protein